MMQTSDQIDVYLEVGAKKTFAGALHWPGWCRSGPDEAAALQALLASAPRYAQVLEAGAFDFRVPEGVQAFTIVERLPGDATTDFGAPGAIPASDDLPVEEAELQRLQALLQACWQALDRAVAAATGKELRKGPRGGGRELDKILEHVLGADQSYLAKLGWKYKQDAGDDLARGLEQYRQEALAGLAAAARGELPAAGPRGGLHWKPRYFVRRSAWHVLDHAWEIADRIL